MAGVGPQDQLLNENARAQQDSLAEWSNALDQGASPQGRGFEPHSCYFAMSRMLCPARLPRPCGATRRSADILQ